MPLFPDAPLRLHARGRLRERELDGVASFAVDAEGMVIAPLDESMHATSIVRLPFEAIDGAAHAPDEGGTFRLHLATGDVIVACGDTRVVELAADVLARGRTMPELTRAVRGLGARGGSAAQEGFFQPLLEARRKAVNGGTAALVAFDGVRLQAAVERALDAFAAAAEPERAAARRALEACLLEAAEPLLLALPALTEAGAAARAADAASALRAWRTWVAVVRVVFERADAAWPAVRETLAAPRPQARPAPASALERLLPPRTR